MEFQVGDKVVHWTYGPGEIIQLDQKVIAGSQKDCYVVQIEEMTVWVPNNHVGPTSLRAPTPPQEFEDLFAILTSTAEPLATDRFERKVQLTEQMKSGSLESICRVIRDLSSFKHEKKMNDHDTLILERASKFLLREWVVSLAVPIQQAEEELRTLLTRD
jgi:RNA polymerase-interacting CarD/CdnL/TRCF family regulator